MPPRKSATASGDPAEPKAKKKTPWKPSGRSAPEKDILNLLPAEPASLPSSVRKIGIHTSTGGGVQTAAERAYRLGCNTFQVFSSSPRMWRPFNLSK
ncbi:MAG: hypothetical protein JOZ43_04145, partial [Acidobacteriales bacterium]|nr:hypothetical protein [Terriglobales bacterium]